MRFVHFADDTTVFASDSDINNVHATSAVNRGQVGVDNCCHGHIEICKSTTRCFHVYYVENII